MNTHAGVEHAGIHIDAVPVRAVDLAGRSTRGDPCRCSRARRRLGVLVVDPGRFGWRLGEARSRRSVRRPRLVHDHTRLGRKLADRTPHLAATARQHAPLCRRLPRRFEVATRVAMLATVWMKLKNPIAVGFSSHTGGKASATFDQSASSSSASTAAKVVNVPCPSSAAGDTIVIMPSAAIVTQRLAASGASAAAVATTTAGSAVMVSASVRPAAVSLRNSRRLMLAACDMAQSSRRIILPADRT